MDDLKLFSSQKENLHSMLNIVGEFSSDIQMKFGLDKCKISSIVKGVWSAHEGYEPAGQEGKIEGMLENDQYKYLGYLQARGIQHKDAKQQVSDDYKRRLRSILKSELSARNTALAINTYATSLLTYTFGILNWSKTELNALDIATRREFRKYRAHHPRSCVERFHLPRAEEGRGIPSAMRRHHQQVQNLRKYFLDKAKEGKLHQAIARADKNITPLNLNDHTFNPVETLPTTEQTIGQWKAKPLHGRYIKRLHEDADIDAKASQSWLHSGGLFVETEGFIAAIHDQVVPTKSYQKRIMKVRVDNVMCRICGAKEETLDHLLAGCSNLAPKQYLERHNSVAKIIYQELAKEHLNETDMKPYYEFEPPQVKENDICRLYWNRKIRTHRTIPNNIPDIVLTMKDAKIAFIIDVAVPSAVNIQSAYAEKISKYMPLADEIKCLWKLDKVIIVPIIIGATGEIPVKLFDSLRKINLREKLYQQLQKAALLGSCRIVRRVLGDG